MASTWGEGIGLGDPSQGWGVLCIGSTVGILFDCFEGNGAKLRAMVGA